MADKNAAPTPAELLMQLMAAKVAYGKIPVDDHLKRVGELVGSDAFKTLAEEMAMIGEALPDDPQLMQIKQMVQGLGQSARVLPQVITNTQAMRAQAATAAAATGGAPATA